ncbi:MAG: DUF3857 and transglutaminase domain-containing protein, partial [Bacteroidales bacterium]|nr:DUF3857 and transglutaminase domain-containing protein [Bacteroidales bacterium]
MKRVIGLLVLITVAGLWSPASPQIREMITRAGDSKDYPGKNNLFIFDSTRVSVEETGLSHVRMHRLVKVLTAAGAKENAVVKLGYDPLSAYVDIREVRIYRADGTEERLDPGSVMDYPAPARAIYWGAREKMIAVGRLEPGDAIETVLYRKGFTYALLGDEGDERYIPPMRGHFYDIVEFWSQDQVLEKVYQVSVPHDKPLQYHFYNGEAQSSVIFTGDRTVYTFTKSDFSQPERESGMVAYSDEFPKLLLSTSPDWEAKSLWFYGVNEDFGSFESTPAIDEKVAEILEGAVDEMDSVSRLTHWVADNIRYSGISMGEGEGYTLHKGDMTFTDRCGVCKDKAGMLITMLRAAGFESYPAMTMAGSRIDPIPADQFNHSITIVKLSDGKYHLLDPTWVPFLRELWSSAEQQQNYLMGLPEGAGLMITPLSPPEKHYLKIRGNSTLQSDGALEGELTIEAEGQTDAAIRRMFTGNFRSQWDAALERELISVHPRAVVHEMDFGNPYDYMSGPIRITMKYSIPDFALVAG